MGTSQHRTHLNPLFYLVQLEGKKNRKDSLNAFMHLDQWTETFALLKTFHRCLRAHASMSASKRTPRSTVGRSVHYRMIEMKLHHSKGIKGPHNVDRPNCDGQKNRAALVPLATFVMPVETFSLAFRLKKKKRVRAAEVDIFIACTCTVHRLCRLVIRWRGLHTAFRLELLCH